jgi:hypothetical protein
MKMFCTLAVALILGTGVTFGSLGCNKKTESGAETKTTTTAPSGEKTTTTDSHTTETKTPEKDAK